MDPPSAAPRNTKKLPRSSSSGDLMGGPARKKKKKDKTGKGASTPKLDAIPNVEPPPSMENPTAHRNVMQKDTATADGHMMAQLLATFSPQELRRFQSFQRASFSSSVIEPFVAACIQHRTSPSIQGPRRWRSLDDCVAPGHAAEIGLLVAVAAKIFAQRLVAEAVRLQTASANNSAERRVLLATSVYRAFSERRGNPAGLFLPLGAEDVPCQLPCVTFAAAPSRRDAALAAQEAYDAAQGGVEDDAMDVEQPTPLQRVNAEE